MRKDENRIAKKGFSYSNSEIHQSAAGTLTKNLADDRLGTSLRMAILHVDPVQKIPTTNMHPAQDSTKLNNVSNKDTMVSLLPYSLLVKGGKLVGWVTG